VAPRLGRRLAAIPLAAVLLASLIPAAYADVDTTPPTGTLTVNNGNPMTNDPWHLHLDVPATDDLSGVAVVQLFVNGGGPMVLDYAPALDIELPWWQEGSNTIAVRWQDVAGNLSEPAESTLVIDLGAPFGTAAFYDIAPNGVTFSLTAQVPTDIAAVAFSCENQSTPAIRPYASRITLSFGAGGLVCGPHYEMVTVHVGFRDAAGNEYVQNVTAPRPVPLDLETPLPAITGQAFTVKPVLPADYVLPPSGGCRWEFRWGNDKSLDLHDVDETYGSLLFDIPASGGKCPAWTFTLPWVPYRQYEAYVNLYTPQPGGGIAFSSSATYRFMAAVGTTERRILSSTLPIAQVLPSTYTPIVGAPITYTRYLIGGATECCNARWTARLGNRENPPMWNQAGGSTFTFTPQGPGNLVVGWDRESPGQLLLAAVYDPPVRYRDSTPPVATAPAIRSARGVIKGLVPVQIGWTATDKGWGVASYRLQRSIDGGSWTNVALANAASHTTIVWVPNQHVVRFRVSAVDKAGNVGGWATGSAFRPMNDPRTPVALSRGVPHP
jgi:hypothetical protein